MLYVSNASNSGVPIGRVEYYNNTNPASYVSKYRSLTGTNLQATQYKTPQNEFSQAFYGTGPYSLNHPNQTSDVLARNIDFVA